MSSRTDVSSVHYDKPGQQEWLVAGAPVDPVWQQDTALSLMVQDEGQQRHDQHKDHGTANHCVRDTGVIVQAIVQSHSVLSWVFWEKSGMILDYFKDYFTQIAK